jgi:hypothetical protein
MIQNKIEVLNLKILKTQVPMKYLTLNNISVEWHTSNKGRCLNESY